MNFDFNIPTGGGAYALPQTTLDFWIRDLTPGAPVITPDTFSVAEDAAIGTVVGTVEATDPDGDAFTFAITGGNTDGAFAIDPDTGEITVAAALDYETKASYGLTVSATDSTSLTGIGSITILITDVIEVVLDPAPGLILRQRAAWSTAVPLDRLTALPWGEYSRFDLAPLLRWNDSEQLDRDTDLAWHDLQRFDVAPTLPWQQFDTRDRGIDLPWRQRTPRDLGVAVFWDDSLQAVDRNTALPYRYPGARDLLQTIVYDEVDLSAPVGDWYTAPSAVSSGADVRLFWPRALNFRIPALGAYALPRGSLDFQIADLEADPIPEPPVLISWAPFRADSTRTVPVDRPVSLGWDAPSSRDRLISLPWGLGQEVPGGEVSTPWENEPPEPTWIVVPPLRVYNVANAITVVRLPERTPIHPLAVSVSYDDEAFAWRASLTLFDPVELALMSPVGGIKECEINVNGFVVVVAAESFTRDRQFPKTSWQLQCRSRHAYLDEPYQTPRSLVSSSESSAAQLALDELPSGWTLDWNVPDWVVPAGAWSYDQLTPIKAIARLAAAAGAVIAPDPEAKHLVIRSRYPDSPADWLTATPFASIPDAVCTRMGSTYTPGQVRNAVIVEGATQGVRVEATRTDTAGDDPLPNVTEQLCTAVECGMERARVELDITGTWNDERIAMPILPSPGAIPPGKLLEITDGGSTWRGQTRGIEITAQRTDKGILVGQTLTIERKMPDVAGGGHGRRTGVGSNLWSRFRALLPDRSQQVVTIITVHANGTSTVESDAGNQWIVIGDSVAVDGKALIQDGRIVSAAADLASYTVSV